jgi:hypothetical protein
VNRRRGVLAATLLFTGAAGVRAAAPVAPPPEVAADLPGAHLQGSGRLRFLGLRIYDARLWTQARPVGADWAGVPCALELEYARALDGAQIAERSLVEMRRQGEIGAVDAERWLGSMKELFPDVKEGDRITGVNLPGVGARFYFDGALRGELRETEFARRFFGIWFAPQTSEPALRADLLGAGKP